MSIIVTTGKTWVPHIITQQIFILYGSLEKDWSKTTIFEYLQEVISENTMYVTKDFFVLYSNSPRFYNNTYRITGTGTFTQVIYIV